MTLITGMSDDFDQAWLDGIPDVRGYADSELPRYANSYDRQGNRRQYLLAEGEPLEIVPFLEPEQHLDVVFLAPAYHEFRRAPRPFREALVGVALQGPLRTITGRDRIIPHSHPAKVAERFVRPGWIGFFSEEDVHDAEALGRYIASLRGVAVLTRGYNGATLFDSDGSERHFDAIPAKLVEPTGAGDCFASAFMFRLAETEELESAMEFALAAGSLAVERHGLAGVPTRQEVENRMTREAP